MQSSRHATREHRGELALELEADTLPHLFEEAARALHECLAGAGAPGQGQGAWSRIAVHARDRDALLVAFLDELIGRGEIEKCAFGEVRIEALDERSLVAAVRGQPLAAPHTAVKAATFHGLHIDNSPTGWAATVVLDI